MTKALTDIEVESSITEKATFDIENFPLHTQAVERSIKIVSEASSKVCGSEAREGFIKSRLSSRKNHPVFESKKDYNAKF